LLPDGKVLVECGLDSSGFSLASGELYDPESGAWTATGSLATARYLHTATLLANGKVLVTGGDNYPSSSTLASAELYDPESRTWTPTGNLAIPREYHTATLLLSGNVLAAGGIILGSSHRIRRAELYEVGLGFNRDWQPEIAAGSLILRAGHRLWLTGSHFQGISQASGGNFQDSSSNYPVVQLRNLDSSQVVFLPAGRTDGWSDTRFISLPARGIPLGPALVTVFTNGIPSTARYLVVSDTP
jgi:hypothetical protein